MMNTVNEHIERGVRAHMAGNLTDAESAYKDALAFDGENATAHNNIGFVYGQQRRWEKAVKHLKTALQINPQMDMAYTNLGQVLMNTGSVQEGLKQLEIAVELNSRNTQAWDNLARVRLHMGNYQGAEYAWMRANNLMPEDPRLLTRLGTAVAAQRRIGEAITIYQHALRLDPGYADAWVQLGVAHFLCEDFGSASEAMRRALLLNPKDINAIRHLGLINLARGKKNEAIDAFKRVVELAPDDEATRLDLAVTLLSTHQELEALPHLNDLAHKNTDNERVTFYRGLALRQLKKIRQGNQLLQKVAALDGAYAARARDVLAAKKAVPSAFQ